MASINTSKEGGVITWGSEDWISGLLPTFTTSTVANQKGNKELAAAKAMNPFRAFGYAYPGALPTDVTNVSEVSEQALKGLGYSDAAYIITAGAKIQKLTLASDTLTASFKTISAHGGHASVVGNDIAIYNAKVGGTSARKLFYSWSDNTDWDVGVFDFSATFDDDFLSTAPATPLGASGSYLTDGVGYPHPLIVGEDDILYIGDRNFIHALDGQNSADNDGKFFPAVLTLPGGFIITSFAKVPLGLMIFGYHINPQGAGSTYIYKGKAVAFLWDYVSLDITASYDLNDNFVSEAFQYRGTVGCFTQGASKDPSSSTKLSKLQLFNGSIFETVQTFIGNVPVRGGVDIVGDSITWNSQGVLYSHGSPLFGVSSGLNKLSEGGGTTSGMLATLYQDKQYMSSGTTTAGGLQVIQPFPNNYFATSQLATPLVEPPFPPDQRGRVRAVKVHYATSTTSASSRGVSVLLRPNAGSNSTVINADTDIGATELIATRRLDASGSALPGFDSIKLILQWDAGNGTTDAPGISKVECFYENVNT